MTVVEACVGQEKIDPPEDGLQYRTTVASLLNEGIAMNTAGSVFSSKVVPLSLNLSTFRIFKILLYTALLLNIVRL